jgi:hypothetical protein
MVLVFLASVAGVDEKGRDGAVRVARLAAALTAAGLKPKVGGKAGVSAEGCTVGVLCLSQPFVHLSGAAVAAEYSEMVGAIERDSWLLVAMEPSCAAPLTSGSRCEYFGRRTTARL